MNDQASDSSVRGSITAHGASVSSVPHDWSARSVVDSLTSTPISSTAATGRRSCASGSNQERNHDGSARGGQPFAVLHSCTSGQQTHHGGHLLAEHGDVGYDDSVPAERGRGALKERLHRAHPKVPRAENDSVCATLG